MDPFLPYYQPDEDSYTLIDCILADISAIDPHSVVLEMGCGSGYLSDQILLHRPTQFILSTDILPSSLEVTKNSNKMRSSLFEHIDQKRVGAVIFNPPYLESNDGCAFYDGGHKGREVIDRFVQQLDVRLCYLLVIDINNPQEVVDNLKLKGYDTVILKKRVVQGEIIFYFKKY